ncbi:hypothetical protein D3C77_753930 [compost metagenome]
MEVTCAYSILDQTIDPAARRTVPVADRSLVAAPVLAAVVCAVLCSGVGWLVGHEPADRRRAFRASTGNRTCLEPGAVGELG